jgi:hypothetical protein
MGKQSSDEPGQDGQPRITRRAALGAGAAAYGAGMLFGAAALGSTPIERRLVALRREIGSSRVETGLKKRLVTILVGVDVDLHRGNNNAARTALEDDFVRMLHRFSGQQGLTSIQAGKWAADAKEIASAIPRQKRLGAGAGGSVYVFNAYNEPVGSLSVSGGSAGTIAAWSNGGRDKYTPASLSVPRSRNKTPGQFATGDNPVRIAWDSFTGTATIKVPGFDQGVSLDDDLILFLATNKAILETTRGSVVGTFDVSLS